MDLEALVASFGADPLLKQVSRSRLRAWYRDAGGAAGEWGSFVARLLDWGLWEPWEERGDRLAHARRRMSLGYRDAARDVRTITIHPRRLPTLGAAAAVVGIITWAASIVAFTRWPQLIHFVFFGIPALVVTTTRLVRAFRPDRVEFEGTRIRAVRHRRVVADCATDEIDYIDVLRADSPGIAALLQREGRRFMWRRLSSNYSSSAQVVVIGLKSGELIPVTDNVDLVTARAICRELERSLEPVLKTRVPELDASDESTAEDEESVATGAVDGAHGDP
ncbi:MAG: hypothetical protein AAGE52_31650 [Myxococcota bacterium]